MFPTSIKRPGCVSLGAYILSGVKFPLCFGCLCGCPIFPNVTISLVSFCAPLQTRWCVFYLFPFFPFFASFCYLLAHFYYFPCLQSFYFRLFSFPVSPAPFKGLFAAVVFLSSYCISWQPLHIGVQARRPRQLGCSWVGHKRLCTCKMGGGGGWGLEEVA